MLVHMWLQDQAPTQSVLQLLSYSYYIFEKPRQSEGKAKLPKPTEYKEGTSIQESGSEPHSGTMLGPHLLFVKNRYLYGFPGTLVELLVHLNP